MCRAVVCRKLFSTFDTRDKTNLRLFRYNCPFLSTFKNDEISTIFVMKDSCDSYHNPIARSNEVTVAVAAYHECVLEVLDLDIF